MRKIAIFAVVVLIAFVGIGLFMKLRPQASASAERPGMTGMEIHKKTDTKSLPVSDITDPI